MDGREQKLKETARELHRSASLIGTGLPNLGLDTSTAGSSTVVLNDTGAGGGDNKDESAED